MISKMSIAILALCVVVGVSALRGVSTTTHCGASNTCTNGKPLSFAGALKLADKTIPSLSGAGSANLKNVIVQGAAQHSGSFKAKGGSFGSLQVSGAVTLKNTAVFGLTQVAGSLHGEHTTFAAVECTTNKSTLSHCMVASILIKAPNVPTEPLIIELDSTTVSGDITFIGAQGQVILRNGGVVKGQVTGGTVINN